MFTTTDFAGVADPGSGAFLTPGSGIRDEHPGSYFLQIETIFWGKVLKFFDADPGTGINIRDGFCHSVFVNPFSLVPFYSYIPDLHSLVFLQSSIFCLVTVRRRDVFISLKLGQRSRKIIVATSRGVC